MKIGILLGYVACKISKSVLSRFDSENKMIEINKRGVYTIILGII
jgi:hypothetical protein